MKKIEAVIFDLDGTILDTTEGVIASVRYTIKQLGLDMLDEVSMLSFIGPPIQESFINLYQLTTEQAQKASNIFRENYKNQQLYNAVPYEGIYELMKELKSRDIKIGIATYKREDYAIQLIRHFELEKYCDYICGGDNENKLKKCDIIKKCLDKLEITDYFQVTMVGDTAYDAIGAEQIGIKFIGVTYGFGFKDKKDIYRYNNIGSAHKVSDIIDCIS